MPSLLYTFPSAPAAPNPTDESHDWRRLGAQDVGAETGEPSWDPQPDDPTVPVQGQATPDDWRGFLRVLGFGRPSRHPAPTPMQLRVMDDMSNSTGAHGEYVAGAFAGPQDQQPQPSRTGNSWRAEPRPWDANLYVNR